MTQLLRLAGDFYGPSEQEGLRRISDSFMAELAGLRKDDKLRTQFIDGLLERANAKEIANVTVSCRIRGRAVHNKVLHILDDEFWTRLQDQDATLLPVVKAEVLARLMVEMNRTSQTVQAVPHLDASRLLLEYTLFEFAARPTLQGEFLKQPAPAMKHLGLKADAPLLLRVALWEDPEADVHTILYGDCLYSPHLQDVYSQVESGYADGIQVGWRQALLSTEGTTKDDPWLREHHPEMVGLPAAWVWGLLASREAKKEDQLYWLDRNPA